MASKPVVGINDLPAEILSEICDLLDSTHRPSLLRFASCNSDCYAAAKRAIFQDVEVTIDGRFESLQGPLLFRSGAKRAIFRDNVGKIDCPEIRFESVHDCLVNLEKAKSLGYVRTLRVTGRIDESVFLSSVCELIRRCTALQDLFLDSSNRIPIPFFAFLEGHRPGYRLHITAYQALQSHEDEFYEASLAAVSQLHSISFTRPQFDWTEKYSGRLNHEAALRLSSLAPGMKDIEMYSYPEKREYPVEKAGYKKARLEALRLYGLEVLRSWSSYTDFSALRKLYVGGRTHPGALRFLISECSFPALQALAIFSGPLNERQGSDVDAIERPVEGAEFDMSYPEELLLREFEKLSTASKNSWVMEKAFLVRLRPLVSLDFFRCCRPTTLVVAFQRHGPTLRNLVLPKHTLRHSTTEQVLERVQQYCSRLENLTLQMTRSDGDAKEVAIYRTLGSLPQLRKVSLTLKVPYVEHPWIGTEAIVDHKSEDPWDQHIHIEHSQRNLRYGHIREIFRNGAIDSDLAKTIFRRINDAKPKRSNPLERLRLDVTSDHVFTNLGSYGDTYYALQHVARSWLVLGTNDFEGQMVIDARNEGPVLLSSPEVLNPELKEVFHRNWPQIKEDGLDWRTGWHSFPLATT